MRMAVKGRTERTITFNSNNLILRGTEATVLEVNSEEQMSELRELESANLIRTINLSEYERAKAEQAEKDRRVVAEAEAEIAQMADKIEDEPPSNESETEDAPPKRKRGRPKGSKNKKTIEKEMAETQEQQPAENSESQEISEEAKGSPSINTLEIPDILDEESHSVATIHTGRGTVQVDMMNRPVSSSQENSEDVRASLEAMAQLEQEEAEEKAAEEQGVDESQMDVNEQMGRNATVAMGDGTSQNVPMSNSVVPEADAIKKADPFIDRAEKDDSNTEEAFIAPDGPSSPLDADDDDDLGPQFIEL